MRHAKKIVIACAAAMAGTAAGPGRPLPLEAQEIRCYDVVCIKDKTTGIVRCVEKLTVCPD
jgi:hypothetical protein